MRSKLEDSIQEKMIILHSDWSAFLQKQYPELFKNTQIESGDRNVPAFDIDDKKGAYDD